jgi:hypothetical protein
LRNFTKNVGKIEMALTAALLYKKNIENISVKNSARVLVVNKAEILNSTQLNRTTLFATLYEQIVSAPVGNRPNRSEPRVVKKRPKPYPRLHDKRSDWHASIDP